MQCVTLWIGDRLGPVERACFRSVLAQGHALALYCYATPHGVPSGVELRNADSVIPREKVFLHRLKSYAPFSDWFRYELQDRDAGTWLDADVYLLAPMDSDEPYLFGEQTKELINNAVLRLPSGSPLLTDLLSPLRTRVAPPWMRRASRRDIFDPPPVRSDPATWPWGTMGPVALTTLVQSHGLACKAQAPDRFYPVPWTRAEWIRDPRISLADVITEDSVALHLWNEKIASFKNKPAAAGSFLAQLHAEGAE